MSQQGFVDDFDDEVSSGFETATVIFTFLFLLIGIGIIAAELHYTYDFEFSGVWKVK
jgi:hypothetical protein